jgi:hypothetical protein
VALTEESGVLKGRLIDAPLLEPTPYGTAPTGQMKPGLRAVTATIGGASPNFVVPNATKNITITREDARATYTGSTLVTGCTTTCQVSLSATISDITAVSPALDGQGGDIRNATVTFFNRLTGQAIATVPVTLLGTDTKVGRAAYTWTVSGPGVAPEVNYTIGIMVSNYYTRNSTTEDGIVRITK